jgi:chromosomal replication initiation ATPase DnaA
MTTEEQLIKIHSNLGVCIAKLREIRQTEKILNCNVSDILEHVSERCGITISEMLDKSRRSEIVNARQIASTLIKFGLRMSLKDVGENMGGFDHSTILHSINEVSNSYSVYPMYKQSVDKMIDHLFTSDEIRQYIKDRIIDPHLDRKNSYAKFEPA